jgi:hypothetical protein
MTELLTSPSTALERRHHPSRDALLHRVWGEFAEMPCLRLTMRQAQRLFGLRPDVCERVLATLVRERRLIRQDDERYRFNDSVSWPPQRGTRSRVA